ncbi:hypothetical protein Trydic_g7747 [Trypoxylus dichotomus]
MVDLGEVRSFLGLEIDRDRSKGIIKIHQSAYIQQLLLKFQMQNCKEINIPIERNLKLNKAKSEDKKTLSPTSRLLNVPNDRFPPRHLLCAKLLQQVPALCQKRTLGSFKTNLEISENTHCFGLIFIRSKSSTVIDTYVDAEWVNDFDDRKSVTGFFVSVFGNIVSWGTRKQSTVCLSGTEAKYKALTTAICDSVRETVLNSSI